VAAAQLGMTPATLHAAIRCGAVQAIKLGNRWRIDQEEVERVRRERGASDTA
jgi:excisionase family DNA binding protein